MQASTLKVQELNGGVTAGWRWLKWTKAEHEAKSEKLERKPIRSITRCLIWCSLTTRATFGVNGSEISGGNWRVMGFIKNWKRSFVIGSVGNHEIKNCFWSSKGIGNSSGNFCVSIERRSIRSNIPSIFLKKYSGFFTKSALFLIMSFWVLNNWLNVRCMLCIPGNIFFLRELKTTWRNIWKIWWKLQMWSGFIIFRDLLNRKKKKKKTDLGDFSHWMLWKSLQY